MKRKGVKILMSLLAVAAVGWLLVFALDTQAKVEPAGQDSVVASLPLTDTSPITVTVCDSIRFKIDTGSDISCITRADLATLRSRGVAVREKMLPAVGRSSSGRIIFASRRYVVDLPVEFYTSRPDSTGAHFHMLRVPERDNVIRNVEFVLLDRDDDVSCLGIDLLRHFALEHLYDKRLIRLHTTRPEGYQDFAQMTASYLPWNTLWPGRRYYLDLQVDHVTDSYFLDTGLRKAALKLPADRAEQSRRRLGDDSLVTHMGVYEALTDDAWVECGNRAGTQLAFYCDNLEEAFSFNPLNFFNQDLLIDFTRSSIALRPFVALPKRHFMGRDSLEKNFGANTDTSARERLDSSASGKRN